MEALLENLLEKIEHNGLRFGGRIPECHMEYDGKYRLGSGGGWTDSFWVGILYLAYAYTGQEKYLALADGYQDFFRRRIVNTEESNQENGYLKLDHDVGFLFSITQAARYRLTRDPEAKEIALKAANVLMERYHEKGGFIRAWDTWKWDTDQEFIREKKGKVIIDSMMNLPLLFWAYQETGGEEYYRVAKTHADTVMRYMVRGDGSTYHTYNFDPETGAPLQGRTRQGYSDQSCWSRGQAWAIYGFGLAFEAQRTAFTWKPQKRRRNIMCRIWARVKCPPGILPPRTSPFARGTAPPPPLPRRAWRSLHGKQWERSPRVIRPLRKSFLTA